MSFRASVIIPTRNRPGRLREAVASCYRQTEPVEVIVMDDASTDDTVAMLRAEFPQVIVQTAAVAGGPCVRRNAGAKAASGEFLVTLDDDVQFASPDTLRQTLDLFINASIGAVTVPFINVLQDQVLRTAAPSREGTFVTANYYGGMIVFRRDAYLRVGGYREQFFMHVEEPDLALRLLDAGYVIRLGTADPLHHFESPVRNSLRLHRLGPRNHVLFAWYNVPFPQVLPHVAGTVWRALRHSIRRGYFRYALPGVLQGLGRAVVDWRNRRPVKQSTYRLLRTMKQTDALPIDDVIVGHRPSR